MLDYSTWEEVEALPSSATYKEKLNAKRRILIQEDEDDDTDVVFWDEHTRPEDIMEGADLEDYYATQRALGCSSEYLRISPLHSEFHLPLLHSSLTVSKAIPRLSPGFSPLTCHTTYAPFTPSKSG